MNEVCLTGRLGGDPEYKQTQNGVAVANVSLATNKKWKDKQTGEWKESVQWHRLVAWRYLADKMRNRCKKGTLVAVKGSIQYNTWEDDAGIKRKTSNIVVDILEVQAGGIDVEREESWSDQAMQERGQVDAAPAEVQQLADAMTGDAKVTPGPAASTDDLPF